MARVLMTQAFSQLEDWPGNLFQVVPDHVSLLQNSATSFVVEHTNGPFEDFTISFTGTGFSYGGTTAYGVELPTSGTISSVVIRNSSNDIILTIDQFSGSGLSRDLAQIVSNMFGSGNDEVGAWPDGKLTWSFLLQGNDTIVGTNDNDRELVGVMAGNDLFDMKGGDDIIWAGAGADTIKGGAGFDVLSYNLTAYNEGATATRGISVNMAQGTLTDSWGFTDKFTGIEGVFGSRFNDKFLGNAADNEFAGFRGRDTLNGGSGVDQASYRDEYWDGGTRGITVDLETSIKSGVTTGFAIDGFGQRDTLISIENVDGTRYNDVITGSRFNNWLSGREGSDTFTGGGGRDTFYWREQGHIGFDDVINDFAATGTSADKLAFDTARFTNMTTNAGLEIGSSAAGDSATFVFDGGTGTLFWDEDGVGGADAVKIVTLTGVTSLTLSNLDLI